MISSQLIGQQENLLANALTQESKKDKTNSLSFKQKSVSTLSEWVGATLAYNFENEGSDNIIAGAKVQISTVEQFSGKYFNVFIVGNIAKITSAVSTKLSDDINEIAQSSQGLSIGISPIYTFNPNNSKQNYLRAFSTINYKVNGFQDVGVDKKTVNLSQFRFTVGSEFEGFKVKNGGKFNLNVEYIYSYFSKSKYETVFNKPISSISALEVSLITPIAGNFGFLTSLTFSNKADAVFQAGVAIKAEKAKGE